MLSRIVIVGAGGARPALVALGRLGLAGCSAAAMLGVANAEPLSTPPMTAPLSANINPAKFDSGPLGEINITGAVSGLGYVQNHKAPGDVGSRGDISNAQVFIQKTDGVIQFYGQFGTYTTPVVGAPYFKSSDTTKGAFGLLSQAYVKIVPNEHFSIMAGKLPTLIGAEYTYTFQNTNIQRGLLWNQENAVNRGVQANFANGPLSLSVSVNDGFYSDTYSWGSALVAYAFDTNSILTVSAGANFARNTRAAGFATPLLQNNQEIYNVIFTHTSGPVTLTPYVQYTHVPAMPALGVTRPASTIGVALLGKVSVTPEFSWAGRVEYISSSDGGGVTNLLYGPGSDAWSLTLTPTYQKGVFFTRAEISYTRISDFVPGFGMGAGGMERSQARGLIEAGVLF